MVVIKNKEKELESIARKDYKTKSYLRAKEKEYYLQKVKEFGLKLIDRFVKYHPNPSKYMRKNITFAHQGLEVIADAMANKKQWAVVSGLNPSSPLHFGHKVVFDELLWLQKNGAEIFIPLTNDESYVVGKTVSLAASRRIAYESIIPSIIAMGFKPEKTHIFVDSDYKDIYNTAMDLSTKVTLNKILGVFGLKKDDEKENPGTLFYRGAVQLAHILLPQYEEFGGPKPTLVPVGIDQHPYILLARDVAEKKDFIPPSELDIKFLQGLDSKGKMSSSRPESSIYLTDSPDKAVRMLKRAFTGGSPLASFQKEHGGIPDICPVFSLRDYHFETNNELRKACEEGEILCYECKIKGIEQVVNYLERHQARLSQAKKRVGEYLLSTKIKSILKY